MIDFRYIPGDTDVFRTSSGCLKKLTTSYDQTRRFHDVWQMTSDLPRLEDVSFTTSRRRRISVVLKTFDVQRLEDVWFMMSWRRLIYGVLETSDLRRLKDVWFSTIWRHLIYDILRTSDLRLLQDVCKMTSGEERRSDVYTTSKEFIFSYIVWNIQKILSVPLKLKLMNHDVSNVR